MPDSDRGTLSPGGRPERPDWRGRRLLPLPRRLASEANATRELLQPSKVLETTDLDYQVVETCDTPKLTSNLGDYHYSHLIRVCGRAGR